MASKLFGTCRPLARRSIFRPGFRVISNTLTERKYASNPGSSSSDATPPSDDLDNLSHYPGVGSHLKFTHELKFVDSKLYDGIPVYRVSTPYGKIIRDDQLPELSEELLVEVYRKMVLLTTMDKILFESQRQGRIAFYMTCYGEEATHFGSAVALHKEDMVFGQYRESVQAASLFLAINPTGVLLWRGYTLENFMNQCYGNEMDIGKGRNMPLHFGSREANFFTISAPLATQMPQASGVAYALKREKKDRCVICYFGDGAASEGDAHAAFNFAATLECPVIFFCRNNGYAISTPVSEQYRGDGIACRGPAYGMPAVRVDGNDFFAIYNATKKAREMVINDNRPVIIEAMTYRVGHHSTSDDSSTYRSNQEVAYWQNVDSPIQRMRHYLVDRNLWSDEEENKWRLDARNQVLDAFHEAEKIKKAPIEELFNEVYKIMPERIKEQKAKCFEHLEKYPDVYEVDNFAK
eukprot:gene20390-22401_t